MAKVQINYKSGKTVIVNAKKFKAITTNNALTGTEWTDMIPKTLFMGVDDIESIYQIPVFDCFLFTYWG